MNNLDVIKNTLEVAEVSKYWYSIGKLREDTLCITAENDGIHTFMFERGRKTKESVHTEINEVLEAIKEFLPKTESIKLGS